MKPIDILLVILLNLLWAGATIAAKFSMGHFPPLMFVALRFTFFALALTPMLKIHPGQMKTLILLGIFVGPLTLALVLTGLAFSNSSTVAVVGQLGVPFGVLLSVVMLKESVVWWRWLGVVLAFSGVAYISFDPTMFKFIFGILLVMAGAFVGAFAAVFQRTVKVPVLEMLAWIALVAAPVMWIATFILESGHLNAIATAGLPQWLSVLYVGIASTLIGDALYFYLIRKYHVSRIVPLTLLSPIFTIAMGVTLMGDQLTTRMMIGSAIALLGVFLVTQQKKGTPQPDAPAH